MFQNSNSIAKFLFLFSFHTLFFLFSNYERVIDVAPPRPRLSAVPKWAPSLSNFRFVSSFLNSLPFLLLHPLSLSLTDSLNGDVAGDRFEKSVWSSGLLDAAYSCLHHLL